jgi:hypothetical protein
MAYFDKEKIRNLYSTLPMNSNLLYYTYYKTLKEVESFEKSSPNNIQLFINHQNITSYSSDLDIVYSVTENPVAEKYTNTVAAIYTDLFKQGGFVDNLTKVNDELLSYTSVIKANKPKLEYLKNSIPKFLSKKSNSSKFYKIKSREIEEFVESILEYKKLLKETNMSKHKYIEKIIAQSEIKDTLKPIAAITEESNVIENIIIRYDYTPYKKMIKEILDRIKQKENYVQHYKDIMTNNHMDFIYEYINYITTRLSTIDKRIKRLDAEIKEQENFWRENQAAWFNTRVQTNSEIKESDKFLEMISNLQDEKEEIVKEKKELLHNSNELSKIQNYSFIHEYIKKSMDENKIILNDIQFKLLTKECDDFINIYITLCGGQDVYVSEFIQKEERILTKYLLLISIAWLK